MIHRERIFGVFKRLQSRDVEGTGIGLSVCRRIVERAGGTIYAESVVGQGSKFVFTLPAIESER
jgi:signal transduction histidine kinase